MIFRAILTTLILCVSILASAKGSLQAVLDKHANALGAPQAWQKLDSLTYQLNIKETDFEVQGVYRITRSGKMRIDIFAQGEHVFTEAFNGIQGWQWRPEEATSTLIDGKKAAALRHGIELPGHINTLLDMQSQGHQLEYLGEEIRTGQAAHLLRLTLKDGHQKFYCTDKFSGRIIASRDQRAFHPDLDATEVLIESRPTEFREIAGMMRSFRSQSWDLTNDKWLATTDVLDLKINPAVDDSYFEPDAIKVLPFSD
jgi:hypothetical protein